MPSYEKKGYLTTDFKIFHLKDTVLREFQYHYHEFDKFIRPSELAQFAMDAGLVIDSAKGMEHNPLTGRY